MCLGFDRKRTVCRASISGEFSKARSRPINPNVLHSESNHTGPAAPINSARACRIDVKNEAESCIIRANTSLSNPAMTGMSFLRGWNAEADSLCGRQVEHQLETTDIGAG
jgi:hypothetical protein